MGRFNTYLPTNCKIFQPPLQIKFEFGIGLYVLHNYKIESQRQDQSKNREYVYII